MGILSIELNEKATEWTVDEIAEVGILCKTKAEAEKLITNSKDRAFYQIKHQFNGIDWFVLYELIFD